MDFGHVPAGQIGGVWQKASELLAPAMERGGNDWGKLIAALAEQRSQLWVAETEGEPVAAMVTRLDGDTLEVWLAGGAVLSGCLPFLETAIAASKAAGTTNGRIIGRKGWARVLHSYGWHPEGECLVKDWA